MKAIENRVKAAEKRQEREPPLDLVGRYYDELSQEDKRRFWAYFYGNAYTMEEAERLELNFVSGTLHFECTLKPGDISLPELDGWEVALDRLF